MIFLVNGTLSLQAHSMGCFQALVQAHSLGCFQAVTSVAFCLRCRCTHYSLINQKYPSQEMLTIKPLCKPTWSTPKRQRQNLKRNRQKFSRKFCVKLAEILKNLRRIISTEKRHETADFFDGGVPYQSRRVFPRRGCLR